MLPSGTASALAAGTMSVLASTELVTEAFSHSFVTEAAAGLLLGVVVALFLVGVSW